MLVNHAMEFMTADQINEKLESGELNLTRTALIYYGLFFELFDLI